MKTLLVPTNRANPYHRTQKAGSTYFSSSCLLSYKLHYSYNHKEKMRAAWKSQGARLKELEPQAARAASLEKEIEETPWKAEKDATG
jgi:hypothetical protein